MKCLNVACHYYKTKICDSRRIVDGKIWRRRRLCYKCQTRYTTLEIPIYIGPISRDSHFVLQQVINLFSGNDPYSQWQQFFRVDDTDPHISHSLND
jgi:hypothetical protein